MKIGYVLFPLLKDKIHLKKFINLALRIATLGLKFILPIIVIRELSIADYGVYGVFQSTVLIGTFVIGFDFYNYSFRQITKDNNRTFNFCFQHQLIFHLIGYSFLIPIIFFAVSDDLINISHLSIFIFILIGEHISQESYRLLILIGKTIPATVSFFIRSAVWVVPLYLGWSFQVLDKNIENIFYFWGAGVLISVIVAFRYLQFNFVKKIDWKWILRGVRISIPFFIGTICFKLIEFSGRYFLKYYHSDEEVGIYTFFTGIASVLFVLVHTVVIIEMFPKLLEAKNKGKTQFLNTLKIFNKQVVKYSLIGFIISIIGIYPLLLILNKEELFDHFTSYLILLSSTVLYCISHIPHYALYACGKDFKILLVSLIVLCVNLVLSFIFVPKYSIIALAIIQIISFFMLFLVKHIFWIKEKNL
jgi:O-antigen/teichoic acid export membrane protein